MAPTSRLSTALGHTAIAAVSGTKGCQPTRAATRWSGAGHTDNVPRAENRNEVCAIDTVMEGQPH